MPQKKKTPAKSTGTRSRKAPQAPKKTPKRREIGAFICLVLGLFSFLGYFSNDGAFINFFCGFVKGIIGWGFYFLPPALIVAAVILAFHRGRPVLFRSISILLVPVFIGALYQLFACNIQYELSFLPMLKALYADGTEMLNGGVLSGSLAVLFTYLFSRVGAAVVFIVSLLAMLLVAFNQTLSSLFEKFKNRERVEYEPEPEPESKPAAVPKKKAVPSQKMRPNIDIPLDDPDAEPVGDPFVLKEKQSFFKSEPRVKTPDQVIAEEFSPKSTEVPVEEIAPDPVPDINPMKMEPDAEEKADSKKPVIETKTIESNPKEEKVTAEDIASEISKAAAEDVKRYRFPPITLLAANTSGGKVDGREEVRINTERLEAALRSFGVNASISNVVRGPAVTRYEMELEAGVKLNKLTNLSDDIALSLGASGVRIAAIPNKIATVGIEVPNKVISKVYLRDIIDSSEFKSAPSKLTFAIGKDISGDAIVGNISKLPHLLVAGTTGSGKSVCLNSLILSILYKATPDEVKFIMIDPKMVEFKIYNGIPHLLVPVVTEAKKAAGALQWAVTEMMKRYRLFSETGARDLMSYNKTLKKSDEMQPLPQIVVIIDELADLMMIAAKEVEEAICRVAQMGRAAGVHLVIATQSPRADVITGLMKANIPSRIAFKVSSALESRIILDSGGNADKLVGNGDMLFAPIGTSKPARIQGTWVSDEERENIVEFIKKSGGPEYSQDVIDQIDKAAEEKSGGSKQDIKPDVESDYDELLPQAVDVILESGQASVSMLQRRLKLGYSRAARLVDQMEELKIVGPFEGSKPRQLLITKAQWQEMQFVQGTAPVEKLQEDTAEPFAED